jgi:hypothetical protein
MHISLCASCLPSGQLFGSQRRVWPAAEQIGDGTLHLPQKLQRTNCENDGAQVILAILNCENDLLNYLISLSKDTADTVR